MPIIIGGSGKRRTPASPPATPRSSTPRSAPPTRRGELYARVRAACEDRHRDPDELTLSAAGVVCLGNDEATLRRRAEAISRDVDELRANGFAGSTDEVVDKIGRYAEAGATRLYLQVLDLGDLDHVEEFATS